MDQTPRSIEPARSARGLPPNGVSVVASAAALGWADVEGWVVEGRLTEFHGHEAGSAIVAFLISGSTRVEWKRGNRLTRFYCEPGSLTVIPGGGDHEFRTDRRGRWLLWAIDPARIRSHADCELDARGAPVEIREAINSRDAAFWTLGQSLVERICSPIPGSRLYAESLANQMAIHLLWNYSSRDLDQPACENRPADGRFQKVIDYIHGSLGNEISLGELADLAGLSPNYFLSAFRQATGKTPHNYLTEQRIARACELLRNPHRSLVDVSLAVGFSSQSHLTTVFRRFMKTTPAAYRDDVLGLRPDAEADKD